MDLLCDKFSLFIFIMITFRNWMGGLKKLFFKSQTAEAAQTPRIFQNWTLIYIPAVQQPLIKEIWFILFLKRQQKKNQPTSSFSSPTVLFMHGILVTM